MQLRILSMEGAVRHTLLRRNAMKIWFDLFIPVLMSCLCNVWYTLAVACIFCLFLVINSHILHCLGPAMHPVRTESPLSVYIQKAYIPRHACDRDRSLGSACCFHRPYSAGVGIRHVNQCPLSIIKLIMIASAAQGWGCLVEYGVHSTWNGRGTRADDLSLLIKLSWVY